MTIRRRPRRGWWRRAGAFALSALVLYLVAATATSQSAIAAFEKLNRQGALAVTILRGQLGDNRREEDMPGMVALALGQSPLLLGSREAVLGLRSAGGTDNPSLEEDPPAGPVSDAEDTGGTDDTDAGDGSVAMPVPDEPAEPELEDPASFADNGVAAKTLTPASADGYIVTGDVFINNRTELALDASLFDGSFASELSEGDGPKVLILHTHASEAYTMPEGQEYIPSGDFRTIDCGYNVVRVGEEIAAALEEAGVSTLHDTTLHDFPEYSGAYGRSLTTAEEYLAEYPSISIILDVHRDAVTDADGSMYKVVSPVGGVNAAQMSFVIGTDGGGLEHPQWRENLKLAAAVQQHICEKYPTLMRPMTVRNSRYNQHLTTGCLLVEVGAAGNSLDEALLSARIFGKAIAETLLDKGTEN